MCSCQVAKGSVLVWTSHQFPLAWGWVDNDRIFVLGRTLLSDLRFFIIRFRRMALALKMDALLWALLFLTALIGLLQRHPDCSADHWYPRLMSQNLHTYTHWFPTMLMSTQLPKWDGFIYSNVCVFVHVVFILGIKSLWIWVCQRWVFVWISNVCTSVCEQEKLQIEAEQPSLVFLIIFEYGFLKGSLEFWSVM